MDPATMYLLATAIGGGFSALGAAHGSGGTQERSSFKGTAADPVDWLSQAKAAMGNVLNATVQRANQPVDLSGSVPMAPMSFPTGYPSRSVGGYSAGPGASQPARVQFAGLNIPTDNLTNTGLVDNHRGPHSTNPNGAPTIGQAIPRSPLKTAAFLPGGAANASPTAAPTTTNPQAVASAQLLLHTLMAQPTQGSPAAAGV